MTRSSLELDHESKRYPLSFTQEYFCSLDQGHAGGAFGPRFILVCPIRITGPVDVAVLQGAVDDVVARALLCRFDDRDSLLFLTVHHSVSDLWSVQVLIRDLGAFYTVPNDRVPPEIYSRPYSLHTHVIEADVMTAASGFATAARGSLFMVLLSAFYVLAHQITGAADLTIRAFTAGRDEPQFQDAMGLFLNVVPFRTNLNGCASFRDIVARTKETFIDAYAHELPVKVIEQAVPEFIKSRERYTRACCKSPSTTIFRAAWCGTWT